jgi:hypothetical protein
LSCHFQRKHNFRVCPICNSKFLNYNLLEMHLPRCMSETDLPDTCTISHFLLLTMLLSKCVILSKSYLPCLLCGSKFTCQHELLSHVASTHRNFCRSCGILFMSTVRFKAHVAQHVAKAIRRFLCRACPFVCNSLTRIKTHVTTKHQPMSRTYWTHVVQHISHMVTRRLNCCFCVRHLDGDTVLKRHMEEHCVKSCPSCKCLFLHDKGEETDTCSLCVDKMSAVCAGEKKAAEVTTRRDDTTLTDASSPAAVPAARVSSSEDPREWVPPKSHGSADFSQFDIFCWHV